jgi:hypothetical protein
MRILFRTVIILIFLGVVITVIALARGYRFNFNNKSLSATGIISISSNPTAAKIFINNELKGVTNTNITLPPGNYQVDIKKDGYTSWKKTVFLKGELVMTVNALLFPQNPSLSPLTNLGVTKAIPIDQTDLVLLFVENSTTTNIETGDGIYLFDTNRRPLNILSSLKRIMLKKLLPTSLQFVPTNVIFSPDFQQGIFEFADENNNISAYLMSLNSENTTLFDITASKDTLINAWDKTKKDNQLKILETYPKEIIKVASESFNIVAFSSDETKIFYQANQNILLPTAITPPVIAANQTQEIRTLQKDHYYVYDKKEDKNYEINLESIIQNLELNPKTTINNPNTILNSKFSILNSLQWYFDSKHLVLNEPKRIIIMDYDGENRQTVYSATLENTFITSTSDGSLIVLANLNPEANKYPDLYAVGIK